MFVPLKRLCHCNIMERLNADDQWVAMETSICAQNVGRAMMWHTKVVILFTYMYVRLLIRKNYLKLR